MIDVTIFPFVRDRVTYLILAGENNHYGGISLDEKKKFTGRHSAANTIEKNNRHITTQQNELACRSFYLTTDNLPYEPQSLQRKIKMQQFNIKGGGAKSQNLRGIQQKKEKVKRKY